MNYIYLAYFVIFVGVFILEESWKIDPNGKQAENVKSYFMKDWVLIGMGLGFYEMVGSFIVNSLQVHVENHLTLNKLCSYTENIRIFTKNSSYVSKQSCSILMAYIGIYTLTISYKYIIAGDSLRTINLGFVIYLYSSIYCLIYIMKYDVYFTQKSHPKMWNFLSWLQSVFFTYNISVILLIFLWKLIRLTNPVDSIDFKTGIFDDMTFLLVKGSGLYRNSIYL